MITTHGYDTGRIRYSIILSRYLAIAVMITSVVFFVIGVVHNFELNQFEHTLGSIGMALQTAVLLMIAAYIQIKKKVIGQSKTLSMLLYAAILYTLLSFVPGFALWVDLNISHEIAFRSGSNSRLAILMIFIIQATRKSTPQWVLKPAFVAAMTLPTAACLGYLFSVDLHGAMSIQTALCIIVLGVSNILQCMYRKEFRYLVLNKHSMVRFRNTSIAAFATVALIFPIVNSTVSHVNIDEDTRMYIAMSIVIWFYQMLLTWYAQSESQSQHTLITERKCVEKMAFTDKLTGAMNRTAFSEIVEPRKRNNPAGVILCDIDHFKSVNDNYGHDVGDIILQKFSKTLQQQCRSTDWLVRWGGEEFIIILEDCDIKETLDLAERMRAAVEEMQSFPNITSSFGVTSILPFEPYEIAVKRADEALYVAKHMGRNRVIESADDKIMADLILDRILQLIPIVFYRFDKIQIEQQYEIYKSLDNTKEKLLARLQKLESTAAISQRLAETNIKYRRRD